MTTHAEKLVNVISPVIDKMYPAATETQRATIVAKITANRAYKLCRELGVCFPDHDEIVGVANMLVAGSPALARPVPSIEQTLAYLSGSAELSPAERLHLGHEVGAMTDDERLEAIPVSDTERAPVVAAPKAKPARQVVDHVAKLADSDAFLRLTPQERLNCARRASANNPRGAFREPAAAPERAAQLITDAAHQLASGKTPSPTDRMNAFRAEQEAKRK